MKIAYFDCFSGVSGDMILGALVDAGVGIDVLRAELGKLDLPGYEITTLRLNRGGIAATKVHVCVEQKEQPARRLSRIRKIIEDSTLSENIKSRSISIFEILAKAEAKVHGTTVDEVHFHEIGAVDAIVDIIGAVIGIDYLGIGELHSSPVNLGSGEVETAHGVLPVPAPATAELLKGIPCYGSTAPFELATPTGAAIMGSFAVRFGPLPEMQISRVAYGAGGKDIEGRPNVLRMIIGELQPRCEEDRSVIIETNIDDMNPQIYDFVMERLLQQGANDAYMTPVIMKKGRPGILLSVLVDPANMDAVIDTIFRETTSIGVRIKEVDRKKLVREVREVETRYGTVRIKISKRGGRVLTATPEYEDCRKAAEEKNIPIKQVMEEAKKQYFDAVDK